MLQRTGTVLSCSAQHVEVRLDVAAACPGCAGTGGCGVGSLVNALRRGPETCSVQRPRGSHYRPGDRVRLCLAAPRVLHAAMTAYALPLLACFAGAGLAAAAVTAAADLWSAAGALAGLALGLVAARYLSRDSAGPQLLPADSPPVPPP